MSVLLLAAPAVWATAADTDQHLPYPHRKLVNVTFVSFDTETTGLNPKKDRMVELAAVKYRNGEIIDEKTWLINPQRAVPKWAQRVHGISTAMIKDAPTFGKIYPEFESFISGSVLIAHNAPFDISFINEELKRSHLQRPPNSVIDSLGLFRKWFPDLKSYSLSKVAEYADVTGDSFHRALADSMYVALIFNKAAHRLDKSAKLGDVYTDAGGPLSF